MKKLISLFAVACLLMGLCACNKKEETIHVSLSVVDADGNEEAFENNFPGGTLEDLLDSLNETKVLTYEKDEDGHIKSVNGVDGPNAEHAYWTVYLNGELDQTPINELQLKDGDEVEIVYIPEAAGGVDDGGTLLGGWQTFESFNDELTDDEVEIFNKVMEGFAGVGYVPIRVIATQVVSGTNYAYLAQGTTLTAVPEIDYYVVTVYESLDGNVEITNISKIDINDIQTKDESETLLGGWEVVGSGKPAMIPDEEIQDSFDQAIEGYTGMMFNPIQVLASQLVSGMNYRALCVGRPVVENPTYGLYVVTWYVDLQGNSEITSVETFNLEYYVTAQ